MRVEKLREDGPFAIETFCELDKAWNEHALKTVSCTVVYADKDQPTHSVRIFQVRET